MRLKKVVKAALHPRKALKKLAEKVLVPHREHRLKILFSRIDARRLSRVSERMKSRVGDIIISESASLLVVETRDFHAEVVRAIADQASETGHKVVLILNRALKKRLPRDFEDSYSILYCSALEARSCATLVNDLGVRGICTTDFHGVPRYVLSPGEFKQDALVTIVHNYDRFATEHLRFERAHGNDDLSAYNVLYGAPQLQHLSKASVTLVRKPVADAGWRAEEMPLATSEFGSFARRVAIVGHAATGSRFFKSLVELLDEFPTVEFVLLGNGTDSEKSALMARPNCDVQNFGSVISDEVIDAEVIKSDFIFFGKDVNTYRYKWSGAAALSLALGTPLIANQTLLDCWKFTADCSIGFTFHPREALLNVAMVSDEDVFRMRVATVSRGRDVFRASVKELARLIPVNN